METQLSVAAIEKGTVIDHIPAGQGTRIVSLYGLANGQKKVTLGLNLPSKTLIYKDLIKVEDRLLSAEEAAQLAIFAPFATVNIICDFKIVKKFKVEIPEKIERIIACPHKKCITNHEQMVTKFYVIRWADQVKLECQYCEKSFVNVAH